MLRLLAAVLLTAALCPAATEDEIRKVESAWASAVMALDTAALDGIFAPQLIYAHSTGAIESKQQYMDRLKTGAQKYDHITHESTKIVPYGDAVVAHSIARMTGTSNGRPFNDHVMMMHLWVKQRGSWKLAAHQTTKLAQ